MRQHLLLKNHTSFHLGGEAQYFLASSSIKKIKSSLQFAEQHSLPSYILGHGNNLLIADAGVTGLVIKYTKREIKIIKKSPDFVYLSVTGGIRWDTLVRYTIAHNYQGVESLSGIPSSCGAAPVQNIGAYGQELDDTLVSLKALNLKTLKIKNFSKKQCAFGYRTSFFKLHPHEFLILQITLKLKLNHHLNLYSIRREVLNKRRQKLDNPKINGNAGSYFQNPFVSAAKYRSLQKKYPNISGFPENNKVKLYAGWLIEQSGWKGKTFQDVGVSTKNALVLINPHQRGSTTQIKSLAQKITQSVKDKFEITLTPEVIYW